MDTKEITIAGLLVPVAQPYAEGHSLTAAEAKALNQVRAENVRNNLAGAFKKEQAEDGTYPEEKLSALRELAAKYDAEYEFALGGTSTRRVVDPFERECNAVAKEYLMNQLKKQDVKLKDVDKDEFAAKIAEFAAHPKVQKIAKQRLKDREGLADILTGEGDAA